MATTPFFEPVQPRRTQDWVPTWRGFFGERLHNTLYGWPEPAFDVPIRTRKVLGFTVHILSDPDAVERVLLGNKANYGRPRIVRRILTPLIGNGLLTAEGEDWRLQRKIVAPTFAPGAIAAMAPLMDAAARREVEAWPEHSGRLDFAAAATRTTMAIIADALFGSDPRLTKAAAAKQIDTLMLASGQARLMTMLGLENLDPSPIMRRARAARAWLRTTLADVVRERGPGGGGDDFFGGLIRALNAQFSPQEAAELAVDNAITFFVAGHETTANALAWTAYCLAAQPELQDRARAEALAALKLPPGERIAALPLLQQVFEESLRLYPPAPRFDREALAADELAGVRIARGDLVSIWPWVIHRHRALWRDPDSFDHTRFAPEAKARLHRFQYLPFGGGPRVCVGMRFATVEALLILARWLEARRLSLPEGWKPDPLGAVTLRPRGGMILRAELI